MIWPNSAIPIARRITLSSKSLSVSRVRRSSVVCDELSDNLGGNRPPRSVQSRADPGKDAEIRLGLNAVVLIEHGHADGDEARVTIEADADAGREVHCGAARIGIR